MIFTSLPLWAGIKVQAITNDMQKMEAEFSNNEKVKRALNDQSLTPEVRNMITQSFAEHQFWQTGVIQQVVNLNGELVDFVPSDEDRKMSKQSREVMDQFYSLPNRLISSGIFSLLLAFISSLAGLVAAVIVNKKSKDIS